MKALTIRKNIVWCTFGITLSSLFISVHKASAQDVGDKIVSGSVLNEKKEPLPGATITALPEVRGTQTDMEGHFSFIIPEPDNLIVISYVGFVTDTILLPKDQEHIEVSLKEHKLLGEVTIEGRNKTTELDLLGTMNTQKIGTGELLKAACCNLSESFETTPSVDVGFTDAVSGYKQIQMLGLAGANTSFTRENIPDVRGLASITGLTFTPGAWVESMQLSKGSGSVVNGYEGTAGQINVEWQKPFEEKTPLLYLNGYQSIQGRSEGNLVYSRNLSSRLSTNLFLHGSSNWLKNDYNDDGFLDNPLNKSFVGANRWFWFGENGIEIQGGLKTIYAKNTGGQKDFNSKAELPSDLPWGYQQELKRIEAWAKIGKVFADQPWKSMGLQLSGVYHDQQSSYGLRHYDGLQQSIYANYIFQSILGNTNNVIKGGASLAYDAFEEWFTGKNYERKEIVPGIFTEYSRKYGDKLTLVAGLRADYHNLTGIFVTPRLHIRYAPLNNSIFRASIGRSQRTTNIFAENAGFLASNRLFILQGNEEDGAYGFKPEIAWNMGLNFMQKFRLNYRDGTFAMDYYYTDFQNQVIVDIENPGEVRFYDLDGHSFAHSFQAQLDYEPVRKWDVRLAYRFYRVRTDYAAGLKEKPLVAAHRAFLNTGYETKNHWKLDYTLQWTGAKRIPAYFMDQHTMSRSYSPAFFQMNAQISKSWKDGDIEVYVGGENLTNFMQHNLILDAENPLGKGFDASLVWGPGMGRNIYAGFRLKIK